MNFYTSDRRNKLTGFDGKLKALKRGVVDTVTEEDFIKKLKSGRRLTVKLGIDPTASDIHLGHTVVLNKLRQFQDMGHKIVLIIGDFTATIGDPSGRMSERPALDMKTIMSNVSSYTKQVYRILDKSGIEIVYNSDWFKKLSFEYTVKLLSKFTLAQLMEHDYFEKRFKENMPLGLHEMLYPIMQGYDSVVIKADIELGGTDQRFNVITGRHLQKESGQEPQAGLFTPILTGLDGKNKMSKSLNNYIGVGDKPSDMFGKVMSIPDEIMGEYFELLTDVPLGEISRMKKEMEEGKANPRDIKKRLAREITMKYHDEKKADEAEDYFNRAFSERDIPYEKNKIRWDFDGDETTIADFMKKAGGVSSSSEARRMVEQGGFYINGEKVDDFRMKIKKSGVPFTFKIGKKRFGKVE